MQELEYSEGPIRVRRVIAFLFWRTSFVLRASCRYLFFPVSLMFVWFKPFFLFTHLKEFLYLLLPDFEKVEICFRYLDYFLKFCFSTFLTEDLNLRRQYTSLFGILKNLVGICIHYMNEKQIYLSVNIVYIYSIYNVI